MLFRSTGYIEPEYGHIYHNATITTCAATFFSWGWARIGIDVQDGIISDAFTVDRSGKYKLVLTGTLNGSVVEADSSVWYLPGEGKTTGSLYIAGRLGGESNVDPARIKNLHEFDHGMMAFLNDVAVSSCKNIIGYFVPNTEALMKLYDVLIALDKSKEWNNESFEIVSYNYLEADQSYKWSFLVRSVQGSAQMAGGTGAALYQLDVTNLSADLYLTDVSLYTVSVSAGFNGAVTPNSVRSEEHTSELQSH